MSSHPLETLLIVHEQAAKGTNRYGHGTNVDEGELVSKVSMMGTITCRDGKGDEMAGVLAEMVEAAREEPGVEIYS